VKGDVCGSLFCGTIEYWRIDNVARDAIALCWRGSGSTARGDPAGRSHAPGTYGAKSELLAPPGSTLKPLCFRRCCAQENWIPARPSLAPAAGDKRAAVRLFASAHEQAIDLRTALAYSCNAFTARVANVLNRESWHGAGAFRNQPDTGRGHA